MFTVTADENKVCTATFTWQSTVPVGNTTSATADRVGLEMSSDGVSQWEKYGDDERYPVNWFHTFRLVPEKVYHFRAYSWNHSLGKGESTEGVTFSTISSRF